MAGFELHVELNEADFRILVAGHVVEAHPVRIILAHIELERLAQSLRRNAGSGTGDDARDCQQD